MKFKAVEKVNPQDTKAPRKYYAQIVSDGEVTIDELVKEIEKFSALSEPDIRGVIIAFENVMQDKLAAGKTVRMDKLGSFYPTLSSNGEEKAEKVDVHSIKSVGINYRPGKRIIEALTICKKHKV